MDCLHLALKSIYYLVALQQHALSASNGTSSYGPITNLLTELDRISMKVINSQVVPVVDVDAVISWRGHEGRGRRRRQALNSAAAF